MLISGKSFCKKSASNLELEPNCGQTYGLGEPWVHNIITFFFLKY